MNFKKDRENNVRKISYSEIKKLHEKLNEMGIEHEFGQRLDGYQIIIRKTNSRVSITEHCFSYGSTRNLVEAWDFASEPEGNLTCDEAIDYLACRGFLAKEMLRSMYGVEHDISQVELDIRNKYNFKENWFGEAYPTEIKKIMEMMYWSNDSDTYWHLVDLAEGVFDELAKHIEHHSNFE